MRGVDRVYEYPVQKLQISSTEFDEFMALVRRERWDWPAVFSVNPKGEIWPWVTWGRTPKHERIDVSGRSRLLRKVAYTLLNIRPEGGRFFINEKGAYTYIGGQIRMFVKFEIYD